VLKNIQFCEIISDKKAHKRRMKIREIAKILEEIAPPYLQESYDNSGLLVGDPESEVSGILFCLDSIESVVDEAVTKNCNLIIAHHPIVFRGLKRLNGGNYIERTVIKAIRNQIAIYAIHTNLDNVHFRGVNDKIAQKIGLVDTKILSPKPGYEHGIGAGLIGYLSEEKAEVEFLQLVKKAMKTNCIRHTALLGKKVKKVALCGGAGSFLLQDALHQGADVLITSDFKYHEFFDAEGRIIIADIGHFESEQFTIELLYEIIREKFPTFALHLTKITTNPVYYL
jgi:dinuclear metal center YbgI/SA1388 family protein